MPTALIRLCRHKLANGRTCRQAALRDEYLCRHHHRLYRVAEEKASEAERENELREILTTLDTCNLLIYLERSLCKVRRTLPAYSHARITMEMVISRLRTQVKQAQQINAADYETFLQSVT